MKQIKIFLKLILLSFLFIACEEGNEVLINPDAKLIWTGSYDVDGCGFFVEMDSILYKPENEGILSPLFQRSEPISVTVQYIDLLYDIEYYCGDSPKPQKSKAIKLTSLDLNEELD